MGPVRLLSGKFNISVGRGQVAKPKKLDLELLTAITTIILAAPEPTVQAAKPAKLLPSYTARDFADVQLHKYIHRLRNSRYVHTWS